MDDHCGSLTGVEGCLRIEAPAYEDARGRLQELYRSSAYGPFAWKQANWSVSARGVLRGLHVSGYWKLVSCLAGSVYDVVADVRPGSLTFGRHVAAVLDGPRQLLVPPGCAHGFMALEDSSSVVYLQDGEWGPGEESVRYDDPDLAIPWPDLSPILSAKDAAAPGLKELLSRKEAASQG